MELISIESVQFEDYAGWYLLREDAKHDRKPRDIDSSELMAIMKKEHCGKLWPNIESFAWELVRISTRDLRSVLILSNSWTRDEGLINSEEIRTLENAVNNAKTSNYFQTFQPQRKRHIDRYIEFKQSPPTLETIDRLVIRSLQNNEREEALKHDRADVEYYLHDGIGRCLPLLTLIEEGLLPEMECEAFVAIRPPRDT